MSLPEIDIANCSACGTCVDECPSSCYDLAATAVLARPDDCSECGICADACPEGAIAFG